MSSKRYAFEFSLEARVANILYVMGIPAHIRGYHYTREAILMAVRDKDVMSAITKRLYPAVAQACDSTPSRVEKAIRHALEIAWTRGMTESINSMFGCSAYRQKDRPTNGEFIAPIADRLRLEMDN
jgi:two-component system response regulator (stage 0 sporulation protein A)